VGCGTFKKKKKRTVVDVPVVKRTRIVLKYPMLQLALPSRGGQELRRIVVLGFDKRSVVDCRVVSSPIPFRSTNIHHSGDLEVQTN
jgi:hypothetical protein